MPWTETCPMDQRVAFIADWLRDEWTMTELAARYGISRKTAYKWVDRYDADPDARVGGAVAGAADARARDGRGGARRGSGAAAGASARGPKKLRAVLQRARRPRRRGRRRARWVICYGGRAESAAAPDALCGAVDAAVGGGAGARTTCGPRTSRAGFARRTGRAAIR